MSTAEQISTMMDDDGQTWEDATGQHLEVICARQEGVDIERCAGIIRYRFADDSVITVADGGWDLGYPECYCWQGVGHGDACCTARGED